MAAHLLLVHSPLVGRASWELVAAELARAGYQLDVPDLTGTLVAGPPYCARQAEVIARSASGQSAILIGHSGAGPLLPAAGNLTGQAVQGYIFVDAGLPTPGQAWMDTVPADLANELRENADASGWLPPWSRWWGDEEMAELLPDAAVRERFTADCPRLPLAMFEEIHPPAPHWHDAPIAYLQLSEAYEREAVKARELGWLVTGIRSHHLALLTEPGRVAKALHELIEQLPHQDAAS